MAKILGLQNNLMGYENEIKGCKTPCRLQDLTAVALALFFFRLVFVNNAALNAELFLLDTVLFTDVDLVGAKLRCILSAHLGLRELLVAGPMQTEKPLQARRVLRLRREVMSE